MYQEQNKLQSSWVLKLIIINVGIYILQDLFLKSDQYSYFITETFALSPIMVLQEGYIWQIFTYMFFHGNFWHIFMNMYALLLFGVAIENVWGSKRFLIYYLVTGIGAGVTILTVNSLLGASNVPTIGASGAVFGLLLAFGMLFPEAEILIFFVIPLKAKYLVVLYGGMEFYFLLFGANSNISHIGHIGGLISGIIFFLVLKKRLKSSPQSKRMRQYKKSAKIEKPVESTGEKEFIETIIKRINSNGFQTVTDDEYQKIHYYSIMSEDDPDYSAEDFFDIETKFCDNCGNIYQCILNELNKRKVIN